MHSDRIIGETRDEARDESCEVEHQGGGIRCHAVLNGLSVFTTYEGESAAAAVSRLSQSLQLTAATAALVVSYCEDTIPNCSAPPPVLFHSAPASMIFRLGVLLLL